MDDVITKHLFSFIKIFIELLERLCQHAPSETSKINDILHRINKINFTPDLRIRDVFDTEMILIVRELHREIIAKAEPHLKIPLDNLFIGFISGYRFFCGLPNNKNVYIGSLQMKSIDEELQSQQMLWVKQFVGFDSMK